MKHEHLQNGANRNHLLERRYLGDGKYYQRGICKGISVGDEFYCFTEPKSMLKVTEVISLNDSKGVFRNKEDAKEALYEAELVDEAYEVGPQYSSLKKI